MSNGVDKELEQVEKLGKIFDLTLAEKYGAFLAPEPIVTPTGIIHLDALLGGGIVSSGPVLFSSTPETGKSTFAYQFSSMFIKHHKRAIVVYLDLEGSGSVKTNRFRVNRIDTFGLDPRKFKYQNPDLDIMGVFGLINNLVELKKSCEQKVGELDVMFIWDSIASTRCSKTDAAESPDKIIGVKARQLSFCLDKYCPLLKFNKVTFIGIDQVRADIKIDGPYVQLEKSVGSFKNIKSATNIYALQHNVQQWIFLSKKEEIKPSDGLGIDGWYIDIFTEKNKLAPSRHAITCVFDKNNGIDKFWSEYKFLSEITPSEKKIFGKDKSPDFPFLIKKDGSRCHLHVKNPDDKSIEYKSDTFYRKDAKKKYEADNEFRQWFDYGVELSVQKRMIECMFKSNVVLDSVLGATETPITDTTEELSKYQSVLSDDNII